MWRAVLTAGLVRLAERAAEWLFDNTVGLIGAAMRDEPEELR